MKWNSDSEMNCFTFVILSSPYDSCGSGNYRNVTNPRRQAHEPQDRLKQETNSPLTFSFTLKPAIIAVHLWSVTNMIHISVHQQSVTKME